MSKYSKVMGGDALRGLIDMAKELGVYEISKVLLEDDHFCTCTGSGWEGHHHYGEYGLIIHTSEVVRSCMLMRSFYGSYNIDSKVLFLAALFHDSGKTRDYERRGLGEGTPVWIPTDHKELIHHIPRSTIIWNKSLDDFGKSDNGESLDYLRDQVTHAILAHHGRREWRSPVAPSTAEAWILHTLDSMSARLDDFRTNDRKD